MSANLRAARDAVLDVIVNPVERAELVFQLADDLPRYVRISATQRIELQPIRERGRIVLDSFVIERHEFRTVLLDSWEERLQRDTWVRELVESGTIQVEELSDSENRAAAFRSWRETRPPRGAPPGWQPLPELP